MVCVDGLRRCFVLRCPRFWLLVRQLLRLSISLLLLSPCGAHGCMLVQLGLTMWEPQQAADFCTRLVQVRTPLLVFCCVALLAHFAAVSFALPAACLPSNRCVCAACISVALRRPQPLSACTVPSIQFGVAAGLPRLERLTMRSRRYGGLWRDFVPARMVGLDAKCVLRCLRFLSACLGCFKL